MAATGPLLPNRCSQTAAPFSRNRKRGPVPTKSNPNKPATKSVHSKSCTKCGKVLPLTAFKSRGGKYSYRLRSSCKSCESKLPSKKRQNEKRWNRANAAHRAELRSIPNTPHTVWLKRTVGVKRKKKKATLDNAWIAKWSVVLSCPVLGMPFATPGSTVNNAPDPRCPSLDRIDQNIGYTPENTRVVSYFVNVSKNAWPEEQYRLLTMAAAQNMRQ